MRSGRLQQLADDPGARRPRQRDEIAARRSAREAELSELRGAEPSELDGELERLTDEVHRDEVARAEQRMRIEQLEAKAAEDFGIDLETLLAEYGPDVPVPPTAPEVAAAEAEGKPAPEPVPYDRAVQEKRAAKAERELALLGKVNPLALEEFAALEERYKFLSDQLEDLKATRRDLLTVVKDVDDRILEVFASAFEDTAREFEQVFTGPVPGRRGPAGAHRPGRHAHHRGRGRGPPARQEDQAAVAAVRRRAFADRGGAAGGDLPGPAQPVLHHGRGGGRARRRQPRPADRADAAAAGAAAS